MLQLRLDQPMQWLVHLVPQENLSTCSNIVCYINDFNKETHLKAAPVVAMHPDCHEESLHRGFLIPALQTKRQQDQCQIALL